MKASPRCYMHKAQQSKNSLTMNQKDLPGSVAPCFSPAIYSSTFLRVGIFSLVFLISCLIIFSHLGRFPLFNPDEALYAEPAREMLDTGEYITTLLNYDVRFTKPPLVIWGMAVSYLIFGVNEFAARFIGACCGVLLIASTYLFTEKYLDQKQAVVASLTLATAPLFVGTAREAITDMPLSLFMAGAMMSFFLANKEKNSFWAYSAWFLTGLAVMTKGPVGLLLPLIILGVYHFLTRQWTNVFNTYKVVPGLFIVALIALPWFVLEIYLTKGAYFHEFIMKENIARFTSNVDSHKAPFWYHLAAVMGGYFPWSLILPAALWSAVCPLKGPVSTILTRASRLSDQEKLILYCLLWSIITVGFFSLSVSKLLPYTVPAFPAIAILVAWQLTRWVEERKRLYIFVPLFLLIVSLGTAFSLSPWIATKLRDAPPELPKLLQHLIAFNLTGVFITTALVAFVRFRVAFIVFAATLITCYGYFGPRLLLSLSEQWEGPLPDLARYAAVSPLPIIVYDMRKPSIPFYTHRKVLLPGGQQPLEELLAQTPRAYVLTKASKCDYFVKQLGKGKIIAVQGKFALIYWQQDNIANN